MTSTLNLKRGDVVDAVGADGRVRQLRALSGAIDGGDFPVVWVCGEREWEAAHAGGRDPVGIPWPASDVSAVQMAHV